MWEISDIFDQFIFPILLFAVVLLGVLQFQLILIFPSYAMLEKYIQGSCFQVALRNLFLPKRIKGFIKATQHIHNTSQKL
jgi:hypothetical protein